MKPNEQEFNGSARLPIPISALQRQLNKSACTLWRWRKAGWLKTVNIAGKVYVTPDALGEFLRRLEAGEFSRAPVTPPPRGAHVNLVASGSTPHRELGLGA